MANEKKEYYIGLDIGTDSVGYAVTDTSYSLIKYRGEPMWGVNLFETAKLNTERRMARTARRRLDRRKQRVMLIQELFAHAIYEVDPQFYIRIRESQLHLDEAQSQYTLFDELGFTDKEYNKAYPTIHHLILDLITSNKPRDVRLVYLACTWLVAHRGHFLSEISVNNVGSLENFETIWNELVGDLLHTYSNEDGDIEIPWKREKECEILKVLTQKSGINDKYKQLCKTLFEGGKAPKKAEKFPLNCESLMRAICGGTVKANELFGKDEYKGLSFSFEGGDDKIEEVLAALGDDGQIVQSMKTVYDCVKLNDVLKGNKLISVVKKQVYEQHKQDLRDLKHIVRKYLSKEEYDALFNGVGKNSYAAYSGHCAKSKKSSLKKSTKEDFLKELGNAVKTITPEKEDEELLADIKNRIALRTFLPKQHDTENRVIPYQLYLYELDEVLKNASTYLPFLNEKDSDGLTVAEKIRSVFLYRVPYYVGPLNSKSSFAWIQRKAEGRILPWNFDKMVDRDKSEAEFIRRMTNKCTYLPGYDVLPRESLAYQRFTVLNEINSLKIDGNAIDVSAKQGIYKALFEQKRRVSVNMIKCYLVSNGYMSKEQSISGVDVAIHSSLKSYHDFKKMLEANILTESQVEDIIERITYTEDKKRLKEYLHEKYPKLSKDNVDYIAHLKYKDFGRLSAEFLTALEGNDKQTGEIITILSAMWQTNCNLMELLSDRYTFAEKVEKCRREFYANMTLDEQLENMRLSNAVKRPVLRALEITKEVVTALGTPPKKFFIEMTRGASPEQKNKRTLSRKEKLLALYKECRDEDVPRLQKQLEDMGDAADSRLQGEKLFLYYVQLGKCMYSREPISLDLLNKDVNGDIYNIDHVYPRAYVKDDSIINNKVLVLSKLNGEKGDEYPIKAEIRHKMTPYWTMLKHCGLISDELYKRLTRSTPFTADEKIGFINRQLTETSQSTKAVATLLKEMYTESEVVYVKARLTSEFRQTFKLTKSRIFNDLHHAKDAYLNIVMGNVYNAFAIRQIANIDDKYNIKPEMLYTKPVICGDNAVWDGKPMLDKVEKTMAKNNAHMTRYAFRRKGGLFNQLPLKAAEGLIPRKKGMPTEKYGGYNSAYISFFIPVCYTIVKDLTQDIMIMPVELLYADRFEKDAEFAHEYAHDRVQSINHGKVSDISFPMGMRILKINTVLSFDGFRAYITGSANKGEVLNIAPFMPFIASAETEAYIKKLERLVEKTSKNEKYFFDEKYDKVTAEKNIRLYDMYLEKLRDSIFKKRPGSPLKRLENGREKFVKLNPVEQAKALLNIHKVFGRVQNGIDLRAVVGGTSTRVAAVTISSKISNWKKYYKDVRIIDSSASGIWEKQSVNLLDLL